MEENNLKIDAYGNSADTDKTNSRIRDPKDYFRKIVKNMDTQDFIKYNKINKHEILIEFNEVNEQIINQATLLASNEMNHSNHDNLFWMELLENESLYFAVKGLKRTDRTMLQLWAIQKYTQKEISVIMELKEKTVNKKLVRIKRKLRLRIEAK